MSSWGTESGVSSRNDRYILTGNKHITEITQNHSMSQTGNADTMIIYQRECYIQTKMQLQNVGICMIMITYMEHMDSNLSCFFTAS